MTPEIKALVFRNFKSSFLTDLVILSEYLVYAFRKL